MAGETRLEWLSVLRTPYSLRTLFVLRRNQGQETRLCKTDYSPFSARTMVQFRVSLLPPAVRRGQRSRQTIGLVLGVARWGRASWGPLPPTSRSHPGWAAESCSDFFIDCCRMCGNCGCSAVSTRQFFGTALRSQQHGVCRTVEYITSK